MVLKLLSMFDFFTFTCDAGPPKSIANWNYITCPRYNSEVSYLNVECYSSYHLNKVKSGQK